MNEVLAQQNKSTGSSYGQQQNQNQGNKVGPIVYQCFICNSFEHKICDYPHRQVAQHVEGQGNHCIIEMNELVVINM